MLLARIVDDQVWPRGAIDITHEAVALIDGMRLGSPIAGQCHPAGIDQDPALVGPVTDNSGEDGKRNVVDRAHADAVHHQIEEYEDAGAHLSHPIELTREMRGRRRTDAH